MNNIPTAKLENRLKGRSRATDQEVTIMVQVRDISRLNEGENGERQSDFGSLLIVELRAFANKLDVAYDKRNNQR